MKDPAKRVEKRHTPRISVDFPVKLSWGSKQFRWPALALSEFGILLASPRKELVGEDVELELTLSPGGAALPLEGSVAYATDTGIAVRFKNISPENRAVMGSYIQAHSSKTAKQ